VRLKIPIDLEVVQLFHPGHINYLIECVMLPTTDYNNWLWTGSTRTRLDLTTTIDKCKLLIELNSMIRIDIGSKCRIRVLCLLMQDQFFFVFRKAMKLVALRSMLLQIWTVTMITICENDTNWKCETQNCAGLQLCLVTRFNLL
jgi:hypothetical protein